MILARPRVMALNRQRSHILVGEKVGYLSTTQTETTATQTVQYLDTGIKLIFRPFISKDGSIRMELAPSVSEATLRQVTTDAGGGMVIPDEKTNEVTTNVRVKDGQTLVLGGLFQEKTTISRRRGRSSATFRSSATPLRARTESSSGTRSCSSSPRRSCTIR